MDHVVVDVEIIKTIEETPGGWDATDKLGVAVACVYQYQDQRIKVYGPDDVDALRERLLRAERITGYNIWKFDFPVIWGIPSLDWMVKGDPHHILKAELSLRTNDLLRRIWYAAGLSPDRFDKRTHGGYSLDTIALRTLGVGKVGNGADAPKWYQQGLIQKVVNYCSDDVCLERDLSDFIDRYGYVVLGDGKTLKVEQNKRWV
jgi:DEAD/DEAH box helicase domain-containing protein